MVATKEEEEKVTTITIKSKKLASAYVVSVKSTLAIKRGIQT